MEYNSFYGGRRGASFVITKSYETIAEMIAAFKQGGDYTIVNYDDYVLIDTNNKNDPDNGKLYRRGYDYNNDMGGAIYEGQIVGPAGLAPHMKIDIINNIEQMIAEEGYEYRRGRGDYQINNNSIVPGKYIESGSGVEKYNDKITWAYCSVRDKNSYESTAYIGFTFPYTVIDFTASSISAYSNSSAQRVDDSTHPFYEKWNIKIPKGIKGESSTDISLEVATSDIEDYADKADDIANNRKVLTYIETNYDNSAAGSSIKKYIGKVNEIENTAIDNRYHLLVYYNDSIRRSAIPLAERATYNGKNDWHDLGYIGNGTGVGAIAGNESDAGIAAVAATMPPYSAWFIVEGDE